MGWVSYSGQSIGERIKAIRSGLRLSLREVGAGVGVAHETIRSYESGEVDPADERLRGLSIYFGAKGDVQPEDVYRFLTGQRDTMRFTPIIDGRKSQ